MRRKVAQKTPSLVNTSADVSSSGGCGDPVGLRDLLRLEGVTLYGAGRELCFPIAHEWDCKETKYSDSTRHTCDDLLKEIVRPLYTKRNLSTTRDGKYIGANEFLITSLTDPAFDHAWKCYARDPCFTSPSGPSRVSFDVMPSSSPPLIRVEIRSMSKPHRSMTFPVDSQRVAEWQHTALAFRYVSFEMWHSAMLDSVFEVVARELAVRPDNPTIYLAIAAGGPGTGGNGDDHKGFSEDLANFPSVFYKSEIWTLVHVINALGTEVRGVIWLREGAAEIINGWKSGLGDRWLTPAEESKVALPHGGTILVPFDASYSGTQVAQTLNVVETMVQESHRENVHICAVIGAGTQRVQERIQQKLRDADFPSKIASSDVIVGMSVDGQEFLDLSVRKHPRGLSKRALFVPQFKMPDGVAVPGYLTKLLECTFCCAGEDVERPPYKFYHDWKVRDCSQIAPIKEAGVLFGVTLASAQYPYGFGCVC